MRQVLTATLSVLALALAGCSSDDNDSKMKHIPGIYIEASDRTRFGAREITMPETGLRFEIIGSPIVPDGNFLSTDVYEVGATDMRRKVLLVQVDGKGAGEIYTNSGKAKGKRLFLLVDDVPVGVHLIENSLRNGDVFFNVEMPGATQAEKDKALFKLSAELNETILKIREEKETK